MVFGFTCGFWFTSLISLTRKYSFLPKAPPGWYLAKSLLVKPRSSNKQTASASPITNCAVVLVVGARLLGQASFSTKVLSRKSEFLAKNESRLPVIAIILFLARLIKGTSTLISGVFPLLEMQITTSSSNIKPKSP